MTTTQAPGAPKIVRHRHPYDDGYWSRYEGASRPSASGERQDGWDACAAELAHEEESIRPGAPQ